MTSWAAAVYGHVALLEWAIGAGCPVDREVMRIAIIKNQPGLVEYLYRHQRIPLIEYCVDIAINFNANDVYVLLCSLLDEESERLHSLRTTIDGGVGNVLAKVD